MGEQAPALLAAEPTVGRPRERELGRVAGDEVLQLLGERAPGAEDQRLERGLRDVEQRADLGVRAALELAEQRLPLRRRDPLEGADEVVDRRALVGRLEGGELVVELDLARPRLQLPGAAGSGCARS